MPPSHKAPSHQRSKLATGTAWQKTPSILVRGAPIGASPIPKTSRMFINVSRVSSLTSASRCLTPDAVRHLRFRPPLLRMVPHGVAHRRRVSVPFLTLLRDTRNKWLLSVAQLEGLHESATGPTSTFFFSKLQTKHTPTYAPRKNYIKSLTKAKPTPNSS